MPSRQNDQEQPADAIAMLKADHQRVKDLFAQYEGTSNADAKGALQPVSHDFTLPWRMM